MLKIELLALRGQPGQEAQGARGQDAHAIVNNTPAPRRSRLIGIATVVALAAGMAGCAARTHSVAVEPPAVAPPPATDQVLPPATVSADQIMTADQLKPGMKGYGLTVFQGAKPERFGVEIISVLTNYDPKSDMILIRCSGHDLEKTGIAAGMSGSPIYIDNKLIGALAYGWRFTVQPIAGVQPIEQMLRNSGMSCELKPASQESIPEEDQQARSGSAAGRDWRYWASRRPERTGSAAGRRGGEVQSRSGADLDLSELRPLATPLMVSGGSAAAMDLLRRNLAGSGLVPLKSGGASAGDPRMAEARIEPGATVAIPLLAGDMDVSAFGTVTAVIGDRVLAFGHPMFGEGPVNMPMATGIIHTFIPSMMSSFKMGSAGPVVGAIRRDESASILGVRGHKPYMAPMTVKVQRWDGSAETFNYQVVDDWYFSSSMAALAAVSSATADHGMPIDLTVHYSGRVVFKGFEPVTFDGVNIGDDGLTDVAWAVSGPIRAMLNNPWGKGMVESIEVDIRMTNERFQAGLERARLEATTLAPGEPAVIRLTMQPFKRPRFERTVKVDLPGDLPDGIYMLSLLDAAGYREMMAAHNPRKFRPESMTELLAAFNAIGQAREDHFYVALALPTGGLATRDQRLPSLPASKALILRDAGRDDLTVFTEDQVWPQAMGCVVKGSTHFQITIDRNKGKRN